MNGSLVAQLFGMVYLFIISYLSFYMCAVIQSPAGWKLNLILERIKCPFSVLFSTGTASAGAAVPAGQRVKGFFNVKSCGNQHREGVFIQGLCLNSAEQRWVCMVQRTSKETKQHRRNQQRFEVKESPNSSPAAEQGGITDKNH